MDQALQLAYLGLEVSDPLALSEFFGDVIGMVPGEGAPVGAWLWRNDDKAQRVVVEAGPANDATFVGFEVPDDCALDGLIARLDSAGYATIEGANDERLARRVKRIVRTMAPWGIGVELTTGIQDAKAPFASPLMPAGFLTDGVGFGHVVFVTTNFDESDEFVTQGLGMVQSDWLETEIAEGIVLEVRFYHCNRRHHTLALAKAPFEMPQKLHHFMVESTTRDDVGAAFDRAWASGLPIPNGLGTHDNDRMFSFYVSSPSGFMVEVGHGARTISEDWDDNRRYDRISAWGHQPLRRP
jgi:biphenyl-2,3-diol 1,2-dioxygenase